MTGKKTNLFVVGAMRAGTTSFMELMSKHPEIYGCPIKETHHFVSNLPLQLFTPQFNFDIKTYLAKDLPAPRHRAHVTDRKDYEALFNLCLNEKYRVDGSISYLHAPGTAMRLYEYSPEAKVIILLRNPLERMRSHFQMDVGLFREERSFEQLAQEQLELYRQNKLPWYSHMGMSLYANAIFEYNNVFGDNVLTISSEHFFENSKDVLEQVSNFLEVGPFMITNHNTVNASRTSRIPMILGWMRRVGVLSSVSKLIPVSWRSNAWRMLSTKKTIDHGLTEITEKELEAVFKNDNLKRV